MSRSFNVFIGSLFLKRTSITSHFSHSLVPELLQDDVLSLGGGLDYLESPVSDGTIEDNFEAELLNAPTRAFDSLSYPYVDEEEEEEDFSDVSMYGIVEVMGDDTAGRRVIVVSACRLPSNKELDHQRLLR